MGQEANTSRMHLVFIINKAHIKRALLENVKVRITKRRSKMS
jgi:hypothetical protein